MPYFFRRNFCIFPHRALVNGIGLFRMRILLRDIVQEGYVPVVDKSNSVLQSPEDVGKSNSLLQVPVVCRQKQFSAILFTLILKVKAENLPFLLCIIIICHYFFFTPAHH